MWLFLTIKTLYPTIATISKNRDLIPHNYNLFKLAKYAAQSQLWLFLRNANFLIYFRGKNIHMTSAIKVDPKIYKNVINISQITQKTVQPLKNTF